MLFDRIDLENHSHVATRAERIRNSEYHSTGNKFERFRGFLELIRRFEFEFCRLENYFF